MSRVAGVVRAVAVAAVASGVALGAAHVSGSVQLSTPAPGAGLPTTSDVLVDEARLVCPGQQRLGASGLRDVSGTVSVAAAAPARGVVPGATGAGTVSLLRGAGSGVIGSTDAVGLAVGARVATPEIVVARGTGALAPGLVATQVWQRRGDDDRGLAVTPCQQPSSDVWLVAGGDGPSHTERLVVSNAGANAVTASLDVLGATGRIEAAAERTLSIPPRSRVVVSLDAVAPDEPSPVVHVTAEGGIVSAVLDDQWIVGATGRGIDDATRAAAPGTDLVVPGVDAAGPVTARLANPGSVEAVAQLRLLTEKGPVQPAGLRAVRVPAASTVDVALPVTTGALGLAVRSDRPLVAAVRAERTATTGDRMGDFAWSAAAPRLTNVGGVQLPGLRGTTKRLLVTAGPTGGTVEVRTGAGEDARSSRVEVPSASTRAVDLGDADGVWVVPVSGDVRAAVSVAGLDAGVPFFSVAAVQAAPLLARSVPVRQVRN